MLLVMSKAGIGVPAEVVHENSFGAWRGVVTESPEEMNDEEQAEVTSLSGRIPYSTLVPANNA
jgi:hypothetical protein